MEMRAILLYEAVPLSCGICCKTDQIGKFNEIKKFMIETGRPLI